MNHEFDGMSYLIFGQSWEAGKIHSQDNLGIAGYSLCVSALVSTLVKNVTYKVNTFSVLFHNVKCRIISYKKADFDWILEKVS